MSMLFPCVVWWINLCGGYWVVLSGRELMRMIGVGIFFVSTMVMDKRRLISTKKMHKSRHILCLSMVPEGRADWVRLLGYCGYGMNTDLLRKWTCGEELRDEC